MATAPIGRAPAAPDDRGSGIIGRVLDPAFALQAGGPSYVQATTTGAWETATRLRTADEARAFLHGLDARPIAVGVELLWEGPPISFVGTRRDGADVADLPDLVERLTSGWLTLEQALHVASDGDLGPVQIVQCGAINAWQSVGPATVWDGVTWCEPSELLAERPDLSTCAHPVAVEVGHRNAWYAMEVSTRTDRGHVVDLVRLGHLAGLIRARLG